LGFLKSFSETSLDIVTAEKNRKSASEFYHGFLFVFVSFRGTLVKMRLPFFENIYQ